MRRWHLRITRGVGLRCGARLSYGRGYCCAWALDGRRRCKWHGGKSTGPRTAAGMANTVEAMRRGRKRKIERLHALGLKAPGGRPSGRWWKRPVDERERTLRRMADLIEKLPAPPAKPIGEWSLPELLTDTARMGLVQLHAIISQPLKLKQSPEERLDPEELKLQRLVGELGLGADKLLARVQESELYHEQRQDWLEMLRQRMEEAEKRLPPQKQ